jgi:hypothetical protein
MRELDAVNVVDPHERTLVMLDACDFDTMKLKVYDVTAPTRSRHSSASSVAAMLVEPTRSQKSP